MKKLLLLVVAIFSLSGCLMISGQGGTNQGDLTATELVVEGTVNEKGMSMGQLVGRYENKEDAPGDYGNVGIMIPANPEDIGENPKQDFLFIKDNYIYLYSTTTGVTEGEVISIKKHSDKEFEITAFLTKNSLDQTLTYEYVPMTVKVEDGDQGQPYLNFNYFFSDRKYDANFIPVDENQNMEAEPKNDVYNDYQSLVDIQSLDKIVINKKQLELNGLDSSDIKIMTDQADINIEVEIK